MPPLPVIANVYRVTFNWETSGGLAAHNVMHFRAPSKTADDVFDDIDGQMDFGLWDTVFTGATIASLDILKLDGTSPTQIFPTDLSAKWKGNGGSQFNALQVCGLIKLGTTQRGPRGRGRVFLPFTSEQGVTNGFIDADVANSCTISWGTFLLGMAAAGSHVCVASYVHADSHDVTRTECERRTATQRRRNRQGS